MSPTVHSQVDEAPLVSSDGAGVALISALVLNRHSCQQQGSVSSGDLVLNQRCSVSEPLVLLCQSAPAVIVGEEPGLCWCLLDPVDDDFIADCKTAG